MNKTQLIDALAARYEGNRKQAAHALDSVLDTITREVARGEKVAITGFGSFERRVRKAGSARNPQTGQTIRTKKKNVPKFTPGQDLKNVVSGAKKLPKLVASASGSAAKAGGSATKAGGSAAKRAAGAATGSGSSTRKSASSTARTSAAKKSTPAKSTAKKTSSASRSTAQKSPAKKSTSKSTASKSTAKKSPAKKTAKKS